MQSHGYPCIARMLETHFLTITPAIWTRIHFIDCHVPLPTSDQVSSVLPANIIYKPLDFMKSAVRVASCVSPLHWQAAKSGFVLTKLGGMVVVPSRQWRPVMDEIVDVPLQGETQARSVTVFYRQSVCRSPTSILALSTSADVSLSGHRI